MDWMQFVAELVKALVWPVFIGTLLICYRRHLSKLVVTLLRFVRRVNRVQYAGIDLSIVAQAASEAQAKVDEVAAQLASNTSADPAKRMALTKELEAAVEVSGALRALITKMAITHTFKPLRDELTAMSPGDEMLLLRAIGVEGAIDQMLGTVETEKIAARVKELIENARVMKPTDQLPEVVIRRLQNARVISSSGHVTIPGSEFLIGAARHMLSRRVR